MFEAQGSNRLIDFVDYVSLKKVEDLNASQVRVMTIHKSKGLEFDAVILPELDKPLGPRGGGGGFFINLDETAENLTQVSRRVDKKTAEISPELKQMSELFTTNTALDALCTLYVGVTRPKYALYMFAPAKAKADYTSATFDGVLINALCPGEADKIGVKFESGEANWLDKITSETERIVKTKSSKNPLLITAGDNRNRMLPRKTPSKEDVSLEDILNINTQAAEFGTAVHAMFEQIDWLDTFDLKSLEIKNSQSIRGLDASLLSNYLAKAIKQDSIRKLLQKDRYSDLGADKIEVFKERPFAFRLRIGRTACRSGRKPTSGQALSQLSQQKARPFQIIRHIGSQADARGPETISGCSSQRPGPAQR